MKRLLIVALFFVFLLTGCAEKVEEEATEEKPVIYLYPESTQKVHVKLDYDGELECTYPEYKDGWNIIAHADGTLEDAVTGKEYSYLFWEGSTDVDFDLSKGYVVPGEDTAEFLEQKLAELGLNRKEANEFIVYWLPRMQGNAYNLITFQNKIYADTPEPDSVLRVFMVYKPLETVIEVEEPTIEPFERKGFTVVEWGGTEMK